jgi:hypothetical protein
MRHRLAFRRLSRNKEHLRSLLRNLTTQLVKHERIFTTVEKAKELRRPAEKVSRFWLGGWFWLVVNPHRMWQIITMMKRGNVTQARDYLHVCIFCFANVWWIPSVPAS